jgi:hypothetical protein
MLVKIKNNILNLKGEDIQYDMFKSPTISLTFDVNKYPNYKKIFTDMWDSQSMNPSQISSSSYKIDFFTSRYEAIGCYIKMIDISDTEIKSTFSCDRFRELSLQERRDNTLNRILD